MTPAEKLLEIAENIPKVYEAGKKAEWDAFWEARQTNKGTFPVSSRGADYLFAGNGWTEETCIPKYDVTTGVSAYMMFATNPVIKDLRTFKKRDGEKVKFDFSKSKELAYTFYRSRVTYVETFDASSATTITNLFAVCPIETVELLKLKEDGSQDLSSAFNADTLKNITIEGKIGYNGTYFASQVLTKQSIISIINALSDTTTQHKITLRKAAITSGFGGINSEEWQVLVASKPNWTISLT